MGTAPGIQYRESLMCLLIFHNVTFCGFETTEKGIPKHNWGFSRLTRRLSHIRAGGWRVIPDGDQYFVSEFLQMTFLVLCSYS